MGQRSAIVMVLLSGGLMLPIIILAVVAPIFGRAAVPIGLAVAWVGFACLVASKWPLLRERRFWSFGPRPLSQRRRRLYWAGYALIAAGLLFAIVTPVHRF